MAEFRDPGICTIATMGNASSDAYFVRATAVGVIDELVPEDVFFDYITDSAVGTLEYTLAEGLRISTAAAGEGLTGGGVAPLSVDVAGLPSGTPDNDDLFVFLQDGVLKNGTLLSAGYVHPDHGGMITPSAVNGGSDNDYDLVFNIVDTNYITDAAVTNAKLAALSVGTTNLIDGSVTVAKLASDAITDLSTDRNSTTVTVLNSTGTDSVLPAATQALAGVLTAADKTLLDSLGSPGPGLGIVNVLDYGANTVPGTTDMTAAINAALVAANGQQLVWFPPGKYRTSAIVLSIAGTRIFGNGATIVPIDGALLYYRAADCVVDGLWLDGERTARIGFWADEPSPRSKFINGKIFNLYNPAGTAQSEGGLVQAGCDGFEVSGCEIYDIEGAAGRSARGLRFAEAAAGIKDVKVMNNRIWNIYPAFDGDALVSQDWTSQPDISVVGNSFSASKRAIKDMSGGMLISGNDLKVEIGGEDDSPRAVVSLFGSHTQLVGNRLMAPNGCTNAGVDYANSDMNSVTVSDNDIWIEQNLGEPSIDYFDFDFQTATNVTVSSNNCSGWARDGLRMNATSLQGLSILGNSFAGVTRHIIHNESNYPAVGEYSLVSNTWANCTGANFHNATSAAQLEESANTGDTSIANKWAGGWVPPSPSGSRKESQDNLGVVTGGVNIDFDAGDYDRKYLILGGDIQPNPFVTRATDYELWIESDGSSSVDWTLFGLTTVPTVTHLAGDVSVVRLFYTQAGIWTV